MTQPFLNPDPSSGLETNLLYWISCDNKWKFCSLLFKYNINFFNVKYAPCFPCPNCEIQLLKNSTIYLLQWMKYWCNMSLFWTYVKYITISYRSVKFWLTGALFVMDRGYSKAVSHNKYQWLFLIGNQLSATRYQVYLWSMCFGQLLPRSAQASSQA